MTFLLLAQAAEAAHDWPSALVAIVTALCTAAITLAPAILQHLKAKRERTRADEAEARATEAELERDVVIEGVERAGHTTTKAAVKRTAAQRGATKLGDTVKRVTKRLAPLLLVAVLALGAVGCCSAPVDAALRHAAILRVDAADQNLPPQAREIARDAADAFEVQAWRLGGPKPPLDVRQRAGVAEVTSQ